MWNLPRPGIEPVSPALTGGFLSTLPPGKSINNYLRLSVVQEFRCSLPGCLRLRVSSSCSQAVDWGCSCLKACMGLEHLLPGKLTVVMVDLLSLSLVVSCNSSSPHVPLHRSIWVSSWRSNWLISEWAVQDRARRKAQCILWLSPRSQVQSIMPYFPC